MATDGPTPAPCDSEVCEQGVVVYAERRELSSNRMESWVRKVAARSGQRVDWHYVGGIPVVKAIGDIDAVQRAISELTVELENLYADYMVTNYRRWFAHRLSNLPRKLKKALNKPVWARTTGEKKRVAAFMATQPQLF